MTENEDTRVRIKMLEKDVASIYKILEKIDEATTKIAEISSEIRKIIAVHDEKIHHIESNHKDVKRKIDEDFTEIVEKINEKYLEVERILEKLETDLKLSDSGHDDRITNLEKWKWYYSGMGALVGIILAGLFAIFGIDINF